MPRDGSGIYVKPFPDVAEGTTIDSAVHNGIVADVETDLNMPRPIIAGGTGATSAITARANLQAEVALQTVTNFDSHVWENGSFFAGVSAVNSPVAGHFFIGTFYGDVTASVLQTVDLSDGLTPHTVYRRSRDGGVWSIWTIEDKVDVEGGTIDGSLTVTGGITTSSLTASGSITTTGTVTAEGGVVASALASNSTIVAAGSITAGNELIAGGACRSHDRFATNTAVAILGTGIGPGTIYLRPNGDETIVGQATLASTGVLELNGSAALGEGFLGRSGSAGTYVGFLHNFQWSGLLHAWVDATDLGAITITSDYRIKKDVADLPGTWDTVKALRPIRYTQAQYTPQIELERGAGGEPMFPADDIERWGFVAHELQETLLPSAANGVKDQPDAVQSLNLAPLVAALTRALQEAMDRIEVLESIVQPT